MRLSLLGGVVQGDQEDGVGAVPLGGPRLVLAPGAAHPAAEAPRLRRQPDAAARQGRRAEGGGRAALPGGRVARHLRRPRPLRRRRRDQGCNLIDDLGTSPNLSLIMFGVVRHI